jgi:hypothetical protein
MMSGVALYDMGMTHNWPSSTFPRKDTLRPNKCVLTSEHSCLTMVSLVMTRTETFTSHARKSVPFGFRSRNLLSGYTRGTSDSIMEIVPMMTSSRY